MRREGHDRLRLMLIGLSVISVALTIVFGSARVRTWATPRLHRVFVASAALGDAHASMVPQQVLEGTPVTLYALVEALPRGGDDLVLYGPVDKIEIADGITKPVLPWSQWWNSLEILWFKVEPTYPFGNEEFELDFSLEAVPYQETFMTTWGFATAHAADVTASGDAYPRWQVGTMRFSARAVTRDHRDRILDRTLPLFEQVDASLLDSVHRVTVRAGSNPLGVLQGYAGIPYVPFPGWPPSIDHPASGYLAGTVLDFWIASHRELGVAVPFVDPEAIDQVADLIVSDMFLARDGGYYYSEDPLEPVTFEIVAPGDLLVIEDHTGVLFEDRGPGGGGDGLLNRWDRALEAYFEPLRTTLLGDAFVADVAVYRLHQQPSAPGEDNGAR